MSLLTNPVLVSVVVLCVLCLLKLNVLMSLIIAAMTGAVLGGISIPDAMGILCDGFSGNANTALAYVLLGTFATAIASTGLADMASKKLSQIMGGKSASVLLLILAAVACLSQNLIPVHIAFIPILIPPMLAMFNEMKVDRRGVACALSFGLKAPYISIPFGFGAIFMGIIADNMTANGMETSVSEVSHYNWMLGCCMLVGLLIAVFVTYRKPREYKMVAADTAASDAASDRFTAAHAVTLVAILGVVVVQVLADSLALAALTGVAIMIVGGAVKWNKIDEQFDGGVRIMGLIGFIMLVAGGYAAVMKAALAKAAPEKLLILGTSRHMIHRICEALELPEPSRFIRIEDVSCSEEIEKAQHIRIKEGTHIIPVPTMELKPHFRGYLLDSIRSFFYDNNGKKLSPFERSVVRPIFSYYGKLTFSNDVLESLVRHALSQIEGVTKINRLKVAINYNSTRNGLAIILSLTIAYGQNIKKLMSRIRRDIQHEVEYTTGMAVEILKITVRDISPQPPETQEES